MMETKQRRNTAGFLCLALAGILALLFFGTPALYNLVLSFKDYSPMRGLWGSPFIGLRNYSMLFSSNVFGILLRNSLVLSLLGGLLPLLPAFLAGWGAAKAPGRLSWALAGVLLLPAFLPGISYTLFLVKFLPMEMKTNPQWFWLLYLLAAGTKTFGYAAFLAAAGGIAAQNRGRSLLSGVGCGIGVMGALGLMKLFTPDAGTILNLYNPMVYSAADTLDTYVYRSCFMEASFGGAASGWVARGLLQIVPIVIACLLGALLKKKAQPSARTAPAKPSGGAAILGIVFAVIALAAALGVVAGQFSLETGGAPLGGALTRGLIFGLAAALIGTLLLVLFGWGMNSGYGILAFALAGVMILWSQNTLGQYLLSRSLGLINTWIPVVLRQIFSPVLALSLAFLTFDGGASQEGFFKKAMPFLPVFGGLLFANAWGDAFSQTIYLADAQKLSVSGVARQLAVGSQLVGLAGLLTALVPLLTGLLCIVWLAAAGRKEQR